MSDYVPPYGSTEFMDEQGRRVLPTSRGGSLITTKAAPQVRAPRPEPARVPVRIERRAAAVTLSIAPKKSSDPYTMPIVTPADQVALTHLRAARGATAVISAKPATPARKEPVSVTRNSIGTIPGQEIDGYIER